MTSFYSYDNQSAMVGPNKAIALVADNKGVPHLIEYVKYDDDLTIL